MNTTLSVLSVSAAAFSLLPLKKQLPGVPFIMQAHGTSWGEVVSKWKGKRLRSLMSSARNLTWMPKDLCAYRQFDSVVAVGERVRKDLTRPPVSWVLPTDRVRVINNGINTHLFCPSCETRKTVRAKLGVPGSAPIIISASRLHAQKGVDSALHSFARLVKKLPDAIYLIAGDGPERPSLEALANDLGVREKVWFLGAVERKELASYLQASDVFLFLTTHVEAGMTLNVMEAMSCGLPCVISEHLDLPENGAISFVSPASQSEVARELEFILRKTNCTIALCSELPDKYSLQNTAARYLCMLNQLSDGQFDSTA